MKKQLLNLGKVLDKAQQRTINGGAITCGVDDPCPPSGPHGDYFCCLEQELCRYVGYTGAC